jgi:uncharacterized protein YukE
MKKYYKNRIAKIVDMLDTLIAEMEEEVELIEDNANERFRDLTEKEEEKVEEYNDCISELQNAIDYIREYAE